jgi:hypothetical protein
VRPEVRFAHGAVDSALYPIIDQMKRAAGFAYNDGLQTKLDKLDGMLARTSTSFRDAALFAEMLSLPNVKAPEHSYQCAEQRWHRGACGGVQQGKRRGP